MTPVCLIIEEYEFRRLSADKRLTAKLNLKLFCQDRAKLTTLAMLLLALAHASYLLAPAPALHCTAHQSCTSRARVLLSENTEREAKAAAAAAANAEARLRTMVREMAQTQKALQQQYVELKMQYAGATEQLRLRDGQLAELREQVERAAAAGAGGAEGGAAGGGEAELRARVSSLEAELWLSKAQADRALADVADLQAELATSSPRCAPIGPTLDTELLALSLPGGPSIELKPEDVVLACCRGLQHPDVPTTNRGLERLFHFTTYECRASLTGRRGSSGGNGCEADCAAHLDNFVREGADSLSVARSLFPLIHCPAFSVGEPTRIAATQTRGAIASMVVAVRAAEAFRHPSGYAKGEQAADSLYAASSTDTEGNELVRFTLQQERRPPLQDCWLVKEILPARLHDMENKYTWV